MEDKRPTVKKTRDGRAAGELNHGGGAAGSGPPVRVRPDGSPSLTPTPQRRKVLPVQ